MKSSFPSAYLIAFGRILGTIHRKPTIAPNLYHIGISDIAYGSAVSYLRSLYGTDIQHDFWLPSRSDSGGPKQHFLPPRTLLSVGRAASPLLVRIGTAKNIELHALGEVKILDYGCLGAGQ